MPDHSLKDTPDPAGQTPSDSLGPVRESSRIDSIDVLRGFALLGILLLNIQSFGLVAAKYMNPTALGEMTGSARIIWWFTHVFGELKFMSLFSMLFGAGIVLMWERAKEKNRKFTGLQYRRMFWLVVFGLLHAHLLWEGDILFLYGICGMIVYWLCGLRARWLIPIGILWFSVSSVLYLLSGLSIPYWSEADLAEMLELWRPSSEYVQNELATMRGAWLDQLPFRSESAFAMQTFILLMWGLWRAGGLMLLGMALFKLRFFSAERSAKFYTMGAVISSAIGLSLVIYGVQQNEAHNWSLAYSFFLGSQFNYWGSLFVSFSYACTIMLCCRLGWFQSLQKRLAAVGRMALTNYLLHTIICTTIFYGHGLGWYGHLQRWQLLIVVVTIWTFQLIASPLWLARFRYGPFEWLWRSLSYWRLQPMRKRELLDADG